MSLNARIRDYYHALETGAPLAPFFAETVEPVKFGITDHLVGLETIAESLRSQTETTADWSVTSYELRTGHAREVGWFSDEVAMGWRRLSDDGEIEWDTRWSGTLIREDGEWRFVRMHVSAVPPGGLDGE